MFVHNINRQQKTNNMSKTTQGTSKTSFSARIVQASLAVGLPLLLMDRKVPTTAAEAELVDALGAYEDGRFGFHRHLPLPALLCHAAHSIATHLNMPLLSLASRSPRLISLVLFITKMLQVSWLSRERHGRMVSCIAVATHAIGLLANTQAMFLTDELLSLCLLACALVQLKKGHSTVSGLLVGLSVASGWASLSVIAPLAVAHAADVFSTLVDPRERVSKGILKLVKGCAVFVLLPTLIYLLSFLAHYSIQRLHTDGARGFSVEFQAALQGSVQEPADKYLMDRSIVTILNQKHGVYLGMRGDVPSCSRERTEGSMWTIVKVHPSNSGEGIGKDDRYIRHGDLVKVVAFVSSMCLRVVAEDTEDKFRKVLGFAQQDDDADENDIWQVIGDGDVVSRTSLIRLRHYKTAVDLCVRNLRKPDQDEDNEDIEKIVSGSVYSDTRSRMFYISDNRNHDFFKKNFSDHRPRETVLAFPAKGFLARVLEHHSKLVNSPSRQWALARRHSLLPLQGGGRYLVEHSLAFDIFTAVSSLLLPLALLLNHVSWRKYGKGFVARRDDVLVCVMYFSAVLAELALNTGQILSGALRIWMALSLLSLLGARAVLVFFSIFLSLSVQLLK